jgi:3-hydroxyisobutyrate dehydrogenase-like beta-hydroxyacid dehydrogenase
MKVGFIGLGQMGLGMAGRLLDAGHELMVYNRTSSKADPLVAKGARVVADPAAVCANEVVVTMLADDPAVEGVVWGERGILAHLKAGGVHLSMSSISMGLAERLTDEHAKAGQCFVSSPVFGRPQVAAAGQLNILLAGAPEPSKVVLPLLEAMGQKVWPLGEKPRDANLVKLGGNFLIAAAIEALAESTALVGKAGIDPKAFVEIMTSTLFASPIYKIYGSLIAEQKYTPPGFAAPLGYKDVKLALAAGDSLRVPLPLGALLRERYLTLLSQGGEGLDWAALGLIAQQDSGQKPR